MKNNGNSYHNGFAYKNDGSLWGWGYNPHGILFTNDTVPRSSPVQLFASGDYLKPSAGYSHMTMLKSDGTLWALGYNGYGSLGQNDIIPRSSPIQLGSDTDWVDSAAGHYFSLGLKSNGTLWAWGYNAYGELGVSSVVPRSSPVQIPGQWSDIGGDTHRAYAKEVTTNRFYTWGYNSVGSHGNGDAIPRSSPIYLGGDGNWKSVDATYNYTTYMVDYNNNLWGTGTNNSNYQIDNSQLPRSNPIQITTGVSVEKMAAGSNGGLILASNNNILGETADPSNILTNQIYGII